MNFKEDQDVRIKVGYEMFEKVSLSYLKYVGSTKIRYCGWLYLLKMTEPAINSFNL